MVLLFVSSGASVGHLRVSSIFEPWLVRLSAAKSWVLVEGFPRMFPLSLQSIISNQMRPRRLRGAWFSRLLRHPARRRSGFILSPGTHTGFQWSVITAVVSCSTWAVFCQPSKRCSQERSKSPRGVHRRVSGSRQGTEWYQGHHWPRAVYSRSANVGQVTWSAVLLTFSSVIFYVVLPRVRLKMQELVHFMASCPGCGQLRYWRFILLLQHECWIVS